MKAPELRPVCEIRAELGPPIERGMADGLCWRIIPISGGVVSGERLSGHVLNLGADWQTVVGDSHAELDTRYGIETHDGAIIDVRNFGYRHAPPEVMARLMAGEEVDPALYYMRTQPRFHTGDPRYEWVNRTVFVGTGERGFAGDGAAAKDAKLDGPSGLAYDRQGNLYIADRGNYRVRRVDTAGTITTVAGNGAFRFGGDGGPSTAASLHWPMDVALDNGRNLYIADVYGNRIRKVTPTGVISTFAGIASRGYLFGDGGPAAAAALIGVALTETRPAAAFSVATAWK